MGLLKMGSKLLPVIAGKKSTILLFIKLNLFYFITLQSVFFCSSGYLLYFFSGVETTASNACFETAHFELL